MKPKWDSVEEMMADSDRGNLDWYLGVEKYTPEEIFAMHLKSCKKADQSDKDRKRDRYGKV